MSETEIERVRNIKFNALRNGIYHASRVGFFARLSRWLNFFVVIFGASAVGDVGSHLSIPPMIFAFVATMAGSLQLVFDFAGKARTHESLQRAFYEILAELSEQAEPNPEFNRRLEGKLNRLYAEEPPPMRALDAISYNAACDSLGYGNGDRVVVKKLSKCTTADTSIRFGRVQMG